MNLNLFASFTLINWNLGLNDTYENKYFEVDAIIGDPAQPGFKPKATLYRWSREENIGVEYITSDGLG